MQVGRRRRKAMATAQGRCRFCESEQALTTYQSWTTGAFGRGRRDVREQLMCDGCGMRGDATALQPTSRVGPRTPPARPVRTSLGAEVTPLVRVRSNRSPSAVELDQAITRARELLLLLERHADAAGVEVGSLLTAATPTARYPRAPRPAARVG